MINKILIRTSDRKTLHKDRRSLGMNGENLQEVLLFCLDEKIKGNGIVEVELPDGTKGMIEVDRTEEGYELPVKSSLLSQTGFVKFQLRILHDDVEIFKSEIIELKVKDSINATASIPEEYPSWVDVLENLKQDLEKSESERVSNENERISAEETRQENFTKMQETVSNAVSNIKDLTEEYNSNAEKETKKFNDNAVEQTKTFNDNSDSKLVEYNKNHTDKMKEYDDNSKAKLDAYNKNNTDKTNAYNDNTVLKEKAYNDNAADKVKEYNTNVGQKETELEKLAEKKINEYNQVSAELTAKVEQVQAENESLKAENKLIKEQIPSASMSGNSIHVEDSGTLDFDWKIRGGHKRATREGYNLLDLTSLIGKTETKNGITYKINEDCSITLNGTATEYTSFSLLDVSLKAGEYLFTDDKKGKTDNLGRHYFLQLIGGSNPSSLNGTLTINDTTDYVLYMVTEINQNLNNVTLYPMIHEGTEDKPYEQYGTSPSPDYPSEIETVNDSVKIDVVNKNLLDMSEISTYKNCNIINNEIKTSALNSDYITFGFDFKKSLTLKNNEYVVVFKLKISSGTYAERINALDLKDDNGNLIAKTDVSNPIMSSNFQQYIFKYSLSQTVDIKEIIFQLSTGLNNVILEIKDLMILKGSYTIENLPSYIDHQSQTAIMPIQQEMLEGDYIADVEHHEWKKIVLTGNENWIKGYEDGAERENLGFRVELEELKQIDKTQNYVLCGALCNYLKESLFFTNDISKEVWGNLNTFALSMSAQYTLAFNIGNINTVEELKNFLNSKYEAGTPVTIYYKLATPVDLKLTEEQKAIREQKLYTYKNITNIAVSDELASIDVEYQKDPTTEHDDLQNQIDEIKQLLSTTQTSALLLDNLQKDVESEVE